ncbi:zinc finger CCHC-type and RNA-bindingmotif-containing protein 1 [Striga asiatica]|uniref:Zinc finger CCHC-type and RNA-bindingmotif-containing protein 1 n=1 Tax=Striga asiatica TaxID=4170 RepID=A0A5A7PB89_STRAF|nr:zinc finger CCHC-type and RNA-bindingmotif-containing protein 1 [Striga asiatica]
MNRSPLPGGRSNSTGLTGFPSAGPSTSTAVGIGTASAGMEGSRAGGGPRCFSCGEAGHRQSACPRRNSSRALLADDFDGSAEVAYDGPPKFDVEPDPEEEHLCGDEGLALGSAKGSEPAVSIGVDVGYLPVTSPRRRGLKRRAKGSTSASKCSKKGPSDQDHGDRHDEREGDRPNSAVDDLEHGLTGDLHESQEVDVHRGD